MRKQVTYPDAHHWLDAGHSCPESDGLCSQTSVGSKLTAIRPSFLQILNLDTHTKNRKPEPVLINLYDQQHKSWKISIFRATSPKAMKTYCTQYVIMDTTRKLEARKANKWSGFSMKDSSPTIANGGEERAPCLRMAYHCSTSPDVPLQVQEELDRYE